mgnify:CR=1 FL=1
MTCIVYGPMACGKTRHAQAIAAMFGYTEIVDDFDPHCHRLRAGALHLSSFPLSAFAELGARKIAFSTISGLQPSVPERARKVAPLFRNRWTDDQDAPQSKRRALS